MWQYKRGKEKWCNVETASILHTTLKGTVYILVLKSWSLALLSNDFVEVVKDTKLRLIAQSDMWSPPTSSFWVEQTEKNQRTRFTALWLHASPNQASCICIQGCLESCYILCEHFKGISKKGIKVRVGAFWTHATQNLPPLSLFILYRYFVYKAPPTKSLKLEASANEKLGAFTED